MLKTIRNYKINSRNSSKNQYLICIQSQKKTIKMMKKIAKNQQKIIILMIKFKKKKVYQVTKYKKLASFMEN